MADTTYEISPVELATDLTVAWLSNPDTRVSAGDVPVFLQQMFITVISLASTSDTAKEAPAARDEKFEPAVTARKSLASRDHIISMIDGKPYKTLRRHLSNNGLTPEEYRARYGLKADYPMVAPGYSEARRDMAKRIGLGRKPGEKRAVKAASASEAAPVRRGRPLKAVPVKG